MKLFEDGDETLFVDGLFLGSEGFAGTELFEDIIHPGHGEFRMDRLLPLAMGVELFAEFADALLLVGGGGWEREGFETAGFVVAGVVTDTEPTARLERPAYVDATAEDAESVGVVEGHNDQ